MGSSVVRKDVEQLIEALYSLREPWRGRFLRLVADLATDGAWNGREPTREDLLTWLGGNLQLLRHVNLLVEAWSRSRSAT